MNKIEENDFAIRFGGIQRLVGAPGLERLRNSHVCIIGVGGVGSWAVEALARSGVGALTLVDLDEVCLSNINRQLPALTAEVGKPKVQVLRDRVLQINPLCRVELREEFFTATTAEQLLAPKFDAIVDAIDTLANKCLLLAQCRERRIPVITVGAAGGHRDATAVKLADLAFCSHDRLLRSVRKILRADYSFPRDPTEAFGIPAVFSNEPQVYPRADGTVCAARSEAADLKLNCNSGYGTAAFVTGTFGFAAAGWVVRTLAQDGPE